MKVNASIKRFCIFCFLVVRNKKKYIYCTKIKKHKQRQG